MNLRRTAIVDDQPLVAAALAQLLKLRCGCESTLLVHDTGQLLSAVNGMLPHLIILDAGMTNALQAVSSLVGQAPASRVVLLDEYWRETQLRRAIKYGVAGYCTKRDMPDEFATAINKVLAGGAALPDPAMVKGTTNRLNSDRASGLAALTPRELELLKHLAEGQSVAECACLMQISSNTAENHKAHIMRKLGLHKVVEVARFAFKHGLVNVE